MASNFFNIKNFCFRITTRKQNVKIVNKLISKKTGKFFKNFYPLNDKDFQIQFYMNPENKPFRICSISGGGVRGIICSLILLKLESIVGRHPSELFDLFIATSTGSVISTILTMPNIDKFDTSCKWRYSSKDLLDVYTRDTARIFSSSVWRKMSTINGFYRPIYDTKVRDQIFNSWLGNTKLKDTIVDVVITSYELCSDTPCFFKTRKAKQNAEDDYYLYDVIKSALAAPTIFPPHSIQDSLYMDALHAKDPSLFGVIEAIKFYDASLDNIMIFSLGTGYVTKKRDPKSVNTNGPSYLISAFNSMINANTHNVPYMLDVLLDGNSKIFNANVELCEENMGICDVTKENIDYLIQKTNDYLEENENDLIEFAKKLLPENEWKKI